MGDFVAMAATIVSGVSQAKSQRDEGKVQQAEFNRMADQEKVASVDRERIRRRRLNQILGTNIAETGARGVKFEGSPQALAEGFINQSSLDEAGTKVSDLSKIAQLRRSGVGAKRMGRNASDMTLLNTAAQVASQGADMAKSAPSKPSKPSGTP